MFTKEQEGARGPVGKKRGRAGTTGLSRKSPYLPEAHFWVLICALVVWVLVSALHAILFHTTVSLEARQDLFLKGGVILVKESKVSWGNIESVNFSIFLETEEPELQCKPHVLKSIFFITSASQSPGMLPEGTNWKVSEEGEWEVGLRREHSLPKDRQASTFHQRRTIMTNPMPGTVPSPLDAPSGFHTRGIYWPSGQTILYHAVLTLTLQTSNTGPYPLSESNTLNSR